MDAPHRQAGVGENFKGLQKDTRTIGEKIMSGGSQESGRQVTKVDKFFRPFTEELATRAGELSRDTTPLPTGEQRVAEFTPDEVRAFELMRRQSTNPVVGQGFNTLSQFLDPQGAFGDLANDLVTRNRRNTIDDFNTQVAPTTSSFFQQSGTLGSTAQQELEARQRLGLGRALGDTEANIRNSFLDRSLTAAGLVPALNQTQQQNNTALLTTGGMQRGREQQINDINFANRFEPERRLGILAQYLPTAIAGQGSTINYAPQQDMWTQLGGTLLAGAGAGADLAAMFAGGPAAGAAMGATGVRPSNFLGGFTRANGGMM